MQPRSCHYLAVAAGCRSGMGVKWTGGIVLLAVTACATQAPLPTPPSCTQLGLASWYHGAERGRTAADDLFAAHRTLPLGTAVQVTAVETGRSVTVRINDRGPFIKGRIIDLSRSAAERLGIRHDGVVAVRLEMNSPTGQGCPLQEPRLVAG